MNGELVIANAAAARLLEPEDHAGVWGQVGDDLGGTGASEDVALASGATLHADIVPITVGDRSVGALVRLDDRPRRRRRRPAAGPCCPGWWGRRPAWRTLVDEAVAVARSAPRRPRHRGGRRPASWPSPERSTPSAIGPTQPVPRSSTWPDATRGRCGSTGSAPQSPGRARWCSATSTSCRRRRPRPSPRRATRRRPASSPRPTSRGPSTSPRRLIDRFPAHLVVPPLQRACRRPAGRWLGELLRRHGDGVGRRPPRRRRRPRPTSHGRATSASSRACCATRSPDAARATSPSTTCRWATGHLRRPTDLTTMQAVERDAIVRALDAAGRQPAGGRRRGSGSRARRCTASWPTYHLA